MLLWLSRTEIKMYRFWIIGMFITCTQPAFYGKQCKPTSKGNMTIIWKKCCKCLDFLFFCKRKWSYVDIFQNLLFKWEGLELAGSNQKKHLSVFTGTVKLHRNSLLICYESFISSASPLRLRQSDLVFLSAKVGLKLKNLFFILKSNSLKTLKCNI